MQNTQKKQMKIICIMNQVERTSDIQTFWGRVKRFDAVWAFKLPCAAMILTDDGTQSNLVADFFGVSANKVYKCLELDFKRLRNLG